MRGLVLIFLYWLIFKITLIQGDYNERKKSEGKEKDFESSIMTKKFPAAEPYQFE